MANKRILKQHINLVCEELFTECIAASLYGNEQYKENAEGLLFCIVKLQSDFTSRVCHPEPGLVPSKYYASLRESFAARVGEIVDQINAL